jgi:dTDP-4-amino-4,6-dideoxygalactose transaminase
MIKFSPPHIKEEAIQEVTNTLRSGWITTGPKTKQFEKKLEEYCGNPKTLCVSSGTFGLEIILRWYGVGEGDEVIIPAYTYTATASSVIHTGAKPVMVDIQADNFLIDVEKLRQAISSRTKVILPVDLGGLPADYQAINTLVKEEKIKSLFKAKTKNQELLGRILVLSDSAHSLGAKYQNKLAGTFTDVTVFSFHAVKNLTTAEGGAIAFNLPPPFDNQRVYNELNIMSLHGQSKDALAKTQIGGWQYDVIEAAYKGNMTDIQASLGLIALKYYELDNLPRRKDIMNTYQKAFGNYEWAQLPELINEDKESSYHLYLLRIKDITEKQRNLIIQKIFEKDVSVNVHYRPLPMHTAYRNMGYKIYDFPVAFDNYSREISLPVYQDLSDTDVGKIIDAVITSVEELSV